MTLGRSTAVAEAGAINAHIGRTLPGPLFGAGVAQPGAPHARQHMSLDWRRAASRVPRVAWLFLLLAGALWPHLVWLVRRLTDGSDEPWGVLAALTVLALLVRARRELVMPARTALLASGMFAVAAAALTFVVPPIFAAAVAMLSLAAFITSATPRRPAAPVVTLLLLALPVIASLQFYLGYPLRLATAHAAAPLLSLTGLEVQATGAAFVWHGQKILVDPPCAGIGMLWVGSWAAALLSYLNEATTRRTLVNGLIAPLVVFAANVLRNALLFLPEAGLLPASAWLHSAIGLASFAVALVWILILTQRTRWTAR
jgi:exosortase/archaeosortase family protein